MVIYVSFHWMPNSIYNISEQSDTMIFMGYKNGKRHSFRLCLKMGDLTSHGQENDTANEFLNQWMESRHIKTLCSDTRRKGTADALVYFGIDHPMIGLRVLQKMTRTVAMLTQTVAILTHT